VKLVEGSLGQKLRNWWGDILWKSYIEDLSGCWGGGGRGWYPDVKRKNKKKLAGGGAARRICRRGEGTSTYRIMINGGGWEIGGIVVNPELSETGTLSLKMYW